MSAQRSGTGQSQRLQQAVQQAKTQTRRPANSSDHSAGGGVSGSSSTWQQQPPQRPQQRQFLRQQQQQQQASQGRPSQNEQTQTLATFQLDPAWQRKVAVTPTKPQVKSSTFQSPVAMAGPAANNRSGAPFQSVGVGKNKKVVFDKNAFLRAQRPGDFRSTNFDLLAGAANSQTQSGRAFQGKTSSTRNFDINQFKASQPKTIISRPPQQKQMQKIGFSQQMGDRAQQEEDNVQENITAAVAPAVTWLAPKVTSVPSKQSRPTSKEVLARLDQLRVQQNAKKASAFTNLSATSESMGQQFQTVSPNEESNSNNDGDDN